MAQNLVKRLLQAIVALLGVSLLLFVLLRVVPGNPVTTMMGEKGDPATIERMTEELGLNKPLLVQFVDYVVGALRGDFGTSITMGKPVTELIGEAFLNTLQLAVFSAIFSWVMGIFCGVVAAVKRNGIIDRLFMGISLLGISVPVFMIAMLLQYVVARYLHWVPISGVSDWTGFILPSIALGWNSAGSIARLVRSSLIEELGEDYIDTARAKGRGKAGILWVHALRNAMLPVVTMMAVQFSSLLSGAVITETIFSINGIGRLAMQAINGRDIALLQGTVLLSTFIVVFGNMIADLLYQVLDPRVRKAV